MPCLDPRRSFRPSKVGKFTGQGTLSKLTSRGEKPSEVKDRRRLTCSLVVLPLDTSTMWKPVKPHTGTIKSPMIHITTKLRKKLRQMRTIFCCCCCWFFLAVFAVSHKLDCFGRSCVNKYVELAVMRPTTPHTHCQGARMGVTTASTTRTWLHKTIKPPRLSTSRGQKAKYIFQTHFEKDTDKCCWQ